MISNKNFSREFENELKWEAVQVCVFNVISNETSALAYFSIKNVNISLS